MVEIDISIIEFENHISILTQEIERLNCILKLKVEESEILKEKFLNLEKKYSEKENFQIKYEENLNDLRNLENQIDSFKSNKKQNID